MCGSKPSPPGFGEFETPKRELADLALDLAAHSAGFRRSLPEGVLTALADLVRSMNCYYSNLIEGHDTHPIDIECVLRNDCSENIEKRNLQLEAKAHIAVQQWIEDGHLQDKATSFKGISEIHRRFSELLPDDLLWADDPDTGERIRLVSGELLKNHGKVGQHVLISPGALPRFLEKFEYQYSGLGKSETIIAAAAAAAHHRMLWFHPFLDGNGRVARLMSYAMLQRWILVKSGRLHAVWRVMNSHIKATWQPAIYQGAMILMAGEISVKKHSRH